MTAKVDGPLKYPGGKSYLTDWIISLMPPRVKDPGKQDSSDKGWCHYVEPYFGGGQVLFAQDPEGISEVICDKNEEVVNLWRVLQHEDTFERFARMIEAVPFSGVHWEEARKVIESGAGPYVDSVPRAVFFFVYVRQSFSGCMTTFTPITRMRTRRGMNAEASAWWSSIDGLEQVRNRLGRVTILPAQKATDVMRSQDGPRTLFYLDPPYLHSTREAGNMYKRFEMSDDDHRVLVSVCNEMKGKIMLSGYWSSLYDTFLTAPKWTCHKCEIDNKASKAKKKDAETECLWCNF
jgi:DNA adenine methylase